MTSKQNPFNTVPPQKVLVTGGTGFIGSELIRELLDASHEVTVLTRNPAQANAQFNDKVRCIQTMNELDASVEFDAVINLAGAPVVGPRWTAARKAVLLASRVNTTKAVLAWLTHATHKPAVWIQASAIGYYGVRPADEALTEDSQPGQGFMSELCIALEAATQPVIALGIRLVIFRLGIVFGPGGALRMLVLPYRLCVGGKMGTGQQIMSWIHRDDVMHLMAIVLKNPEMQGIYNVVAPEAVTQAAFAEAVGRQLHRPVWCHVPEAPIRWLTGEMGQLFVDGQRVVPARLTGAHYAFRYPTLQSALQDLL